MEILCHRGYWDSKYEQNTLSSFELAFRKGFGVETDIRDSCGSIVISHDPFCNEEMTPLESLLEIWRDFDYPTLALNIKADGLSERLVELMSRYESSNYFFFDMSFPESRNYRMRSLPLAERLSEFEKDLRPSALYWLDSFETDWWLSDRTICDLANNCFIVDPEIHGRNNLETIGYIKSMGFKGICTDKPDTWI